jgi:hypothetical protein
MFKKIFHQIFHGALVGITLLTLLAFVPGSALTVKAQDGPVMLPNDKRTFRTGNVSTMWNDTVVRNNLSAALVGTGIYDDIDSAWVYYGNWTAYTGSGPFNNTMHYSATIGDYAMLAFQGTQFILTHTGYTNRGQIEVYIDDHLEGTLDEYNPTLVWQKTANSPSSVTNDTHILKLVHSSGDYVDIDAIQIIGELIDDIDGAWTYSGNWTAYTGTGPLNGTMHYSATIGDFATLDFQGSQFILTYTGYTNRGGLDVLVDDVIVGTLNEYNSTLAWQSTWISSHFTNVAHTLKLVHASGAYVDIDAIEILQVTPLGSGTYDDIDSAWAYVGNWTAYTGTGPLNNTMHYSATIGDYATLVFQGTNFILTHTGFTNRGQVEVYIDNVLKGTINENNPTLVWQKTASGPSPVTNDTHILKLVHSSGDYIDIDAIQIEPPDGTPPAVITTLQAVPGSSNGSVDLSWKAVGDDGMTGGAATSYQVKWSYSEITNYATWNNAHPINTDIPTPHYPGMTETMTVSGLDPGTLYYFAVLALDDGSRANLDTFDDSSAYPFSPPRPDNDDFANAIDIETTPYTNTQNYFDVATTEPGDPKISECSSDEGKYSIWYTYQAPDDGILTVDTYGTNLAYDTIVAIWTDPAFTHVACNRNASRATTLSEASAYVNSGTIYYIEVIQYSKAATSASAVHSLEASPINEVVLNAKFNPTTLLGIDKYDDNDSAWIYYGGWTLYRGSGPFNDTMHYSATIGDYALLAFQGSQFILTYAGFTNRGGVDVYIDNVNVGTLNEYNPTLVWQKTWASPHVTDGTHTLKLVHTSGTYVDIDAIEILQVTPLRSGKYDDIHSAWAYIGDWGAYTGSGPFNNTMHYSATTGDYATLTFQGTQFTLTHTGYANRGQIEVYVDNHLEGTLDEYNPTLVWQKTANSPSSVTNDTHILKLVHFSGAYIDIDAIQIIGEVIDDADGAWTYSGNWTAYTGTGPLNDTMHYSATIGDFATLDFQGSQFILTYAGYTNRGGLDVLVDNVNVGTLNEYNSTLAWQSTWISSHFTNVAHTLKLVHASGAYVDIDAIEILQVTPLGSGTYDDTNSAWAYVGNWTAYTGTGPLNDTMHYSATIGDFATLVFQGTNFILTYTGSTNRGQVEVYIDNVLKGTINENNPTLVWQKPANGPSPVTNDTHVLKLVHFSGAYVDIDAIQIIAP